MWHQHLLTLHVLSTVGYLPQCLRVPEGSSGRIMFVFPTKSPMTRLVKLVSHCAFEFNIRHAYLHLLLNHVCDPKREHVSQIWSLCFRFHHDQLALHKAMQSSFLNLNVFVDLGLTHQKFTFLFVSAHTIPGSTNLQDVNFNMDLASFCQAPILLWCCPSTCKELHHCSSQW
jgi:hypothetical protein